MPFCNGKHRLFKLCGKWNGTTGSEYFCRGKRYPKHLIVFRWTLRLLNNGKVNIFGELSLLMKNHVCSPSNEHMEWCLDVKINQHVCHFFKVLCDLLAIL